MSSNSALRGTTTPGTNAGSFAPHRQKEADTSTVLAAPSCTRCAEPIGDYSWAGLCAECAEDESTCPTCGGSTSGMNPAENGCPICGGGHNDCGRCGKTDCASYRDDDQVLCDDCYNEDDEDED